ncbi:MAG: hypothetical protein LBK66_07965, partial [Spirochaetaceae bacterium]|nr:hypothetical protein [Spirochaetaceae bacterium]
AMANYLDIQKEETLKAHVFRDYFDATRFAYDPKIGNIDFIVTDAKLAAGGLFKAHYLWAEAKKGEVDEVSMITQLVLTCKKTYDSGEFMPPPYLGCFDGKKIGFLPFHDILPIFAENDINWNAAPSNYLSDDFIKARKKITKLLAKNFIVYDFNEDSAEIKSFIKNNFIPGMASIKSPITKNNFPHIYNRWVTEVKPTINISAEEWIEFKNSGVLDCDFFRADIMSKDGTTITERLKIVLGNDRYKLQEQIKGRLFSSEIDFTDGGAAYRRFWNKYERPPAEEYQQYIIDRRDLLVPQNIREVKGSFFTPQIWVEKSQEYIEKALGVNWQDEYIIWDCAAGTGNLLAGLVNKYNIWASTIDQPDVDTMHAMIDEGLNLLHDHVFKFDFLNDKFDKLPEELKEIVTDPGKRKKLIVYINPPYAESSGGPGAKKGVTTSHATHYEYKDCLGKAANELFALFMTHVYVQLKGVHLAMFSTLKYLNSSNFTKFREWFAAVFDKGFMCKANTFDNVNGEFPIGFLVWDITGDEFKNHFPKIVKLDVLNTDGSYISKKSFYNGQVYINKWIVPFGAEKNLIGNLYFTSNDFQQNNLVYISLQGTGSHLSSIAINESNIFIASIYYSVRHCLDHTWINHNDQFLNPTGNDYKKDKMFLNDCLIYTLFGNKNRISCKDGVNHWIPYSEQEAGAKGKFKSDFMYNFIKDTKFSREAKEVLDSGLELWRYYHAKTQNNKTISVNASFYDIREYFQGRASNGKMNNKSTDETYNKIIKALRNNVKLLAQKTEPKIYGYGFLKG